MQPPPYFEQIVEKLRQWIEWSAPLRDARGKKQSALLLQDFSRICHIRRERNHQEIDALMEMIVGKRSKEPGWTHRTCVLRLGVAMNMVTPGSPHWEFLFIHSFVKGVKIPPPASIQSIDMVREVGTEWTQWTVRETLGLLQNIPATLRDMVWGYALVMYKGRYPTLQSTIDDKVYHPLLYNIFHRVCLISFQSLSMACGIYEAIRMCECLQLAVRAKEGIARWRNSSLLGRVDLFDEPQLPLQRMATFVKGWMAREQARSLHESYRQHFKSCRLNILQEELWHLFSIGSRYTSPSQRFCIWASIMRKSGVLFLSTGGKELHRMIEDFEHTLTTGSFPTSDLSHEAMEDVFDDFFYPNVDTFNKFRVNKTLTM